MSEDEIIAFVEIHEGSSYTEIENHFMNTKGWSKGKFINHWKKAKKHIEKQLVEGHPRYFTKEHLERKEGKETFEESGSEKDKLSMIYRFLSGVMVVTLFILVWINMKPKVYHAVSMLNSTLTATHRQVILLALETYPYVLVSVAMLALLFYLRRYPKHSATSFQASKAHARIQKI